MGLFRYRARTRDGGLTHGTAEGPDARAVVRLLREQGLYVVDLKPIRRPNDRERAGAVPRGPAQAGESNADLPGTAGNFLPELVLHTGDLSSPGTALDTGARPPERPFPWRQRIRLRRGTRIPLAALAAFCRQAATALGAGMPIVAAIRLMSQQTDHSGLRSALQAVVESVEQGSSLAEAFARQGDAFPAIMVNMVQAGETGGILNVTLGRLADHLEKEDALNQKIRSATTYPKIVTAVGLGVIVLLTTVVVPQFAALFHDMKTPLPLPTRFLLKLSQVLSRSWYAWLGGLIVAYAAFRVYGQMPSGRLRLHSLLLRTPIFGRLALFRGIARFCRTLGSLVGAGVPILTALDLVVRTVGNAALEQDVTAALQHVRLGGRLSTPLRESRWFPPMVVEMVELGEETGALDQMLGKVADFYERELDRLAERFTAALEPAIIIGLGGAVAFILLSVYLPMFEAFTRPPRVR